MVEGTGAFGSHEPLTHDCTRGRAGAPLRSAPTAPREKCQCACDDHAERAARCRDAARHFAGAASRITGELRPGEFATTSTARIGATVAGGPPGRPAALTGDRAAAVARLAGAR